MAIIFCFVRAMKLIRLAFITLDTKDKLKLNPNSVFKVGEVDVALQQAAPPNENDELKKHHFLAYAYLGLESLPEKTEDNKIIVPEKERRKAESALEAVANIISVTEHCHREISSPFPCLAFDPEDDTSRKWLESSDGLLTNRGGVPNAISKVEINEKTLKAISDRIDGVTLLSEALAHKNASGKYHELIRLFERAFSLAPSQMAKKLSQFLEQSELGYSKDEVKKWLEVRNPATHGDKQNNDELIFEADVSKFVPRMEQAGYDILFNKKLWRNRSRERRDIWSPSVGTISADHALMVTKGDATAVSFILYDDFQSYPVNLKGFLKELPEVFWSKWAT